ncbi:MAG: hypothetical protein WC856_20630 [Methylococcaceae bacterium]|jgi:hypothetical protein
MRLDSPFLWIPTQWLWAIWLILVAATLGMGYFLQKQGAELDRLLPYGVLEIETPWSPERAVEIREALGKEGIEIARQQTLADFFFLILYPLAISLSCALVAGSLHDKAGAIGMTVAWGVLLAGPFDAVENLSILRQLAGYTASPWPQLSTVCAAVKFTLTAGGLGFIGLGLVLKLKYL